MTLTAKSVSCSQRSPKIMIRPCFTRATKRNIQTHTHTHTHTDRHRHRHRHTHNETHQNRRTYCASQTFCKEGVARGERHIHKHTHTHARKKHTQALSACRRWCMPLRRETRAYRYSTLQLIPADMTMEFSESNSDRNEKHSVN